MASAPGLRASLIRHRARVIHMTRRNLVNQAASSIRATDLYRPSGRYNRAVGQEELRPGAWAIPYARFDCMLNRLESHMRAPDRFVSDLPLPVLQVQHEEVLADRQATLARVCDWLAEPPFPAGTRSSKVTPDDLSEVVSSFAELAEQYRGTRFERYFS